MRPWLFATTCITLAILAPWQAFGAPEYRLAADSTKVDDANSRKGRSRSPYSTDIILLNYDEGRKLEGLNGLAIAAKYNDYDAAIAILEKNPPIDFVEYDNNTAVSYAIINDSLDVLELLLERGANPNYRLYQAHYTPIMLACDGGNLDAVRLLMRYGANLKLTDDGKNTPLHFASAKGNNAVVEYLLGLGMAVNAKNSEGDTPLMAACTGDRLATAKLLVSKGARINDKDNTESTPLMMAANNGTIGLVRFLIEHGANVSATNIRGESAFDVSKEEDVQEYINTRQNNRDSAYRTHQESVWKSVLGNIANKHYKEADRLFQTLDPFVMQDKFEDGQSSLATAKTRIKGRVVPLKLKLDSVVSNGVIALLDLDDLDYRVHVAGIKSGAFVHNEQFQIFARIEGTYTYRTIAGSVNTIPSVSLVYFLKD